MNPNGQGDFQETGGRTERGGERNASEDVRAGRGREKAARASWSGGKVYYGALLGQSVGAKGIHWENLQSARSAQGTLAVGASAVTT